MKIKLLLAPSLLVIAAAFFIWTVYPAYTNGVDGVKEKYQKLKEQKRLSEKLSDRYDNVKKLASDLDADVSGKNTLLSYIPADKEDEKIFENINSIAIKNNLAVLNISLSDVPVEIAPVVEVVDQVDSSLAAIAAGTSPDVENAAVLNSEAKLPFDVVNPRKVIAKVSVLGTYADEMALLDSLSKVKRFNKVSSLEIKTTKKEDESLSDSLQMIAELEFNYLADNYRVEEKDINTDFFFDGVFSKDVIAEIDKNKSIELNNVLPGNSGKSNPFFLAN
ncbi:MAG: hypothetical protein WAV31_01095 [Candidatus Moraniibacteriota bacterium]